MSNLFIVSTPIGNLGDITLRALEVLKKVDVIAAEDTRNTGNLLNHYNITAKKLIAFHSHNEINSSKGIIMMLDEGKDVAICTDAGTPCISDPGARLVEELKYNEHKIIPIPGVSAATTLVSVSGNCGKSWLFEGFLPKTAGKQRKRLEYLLSLNIAFIIYESPFRILKLLENIKSIDDTVKITFTRELTKLHEEILTTDIISLVDILSRRDNIKGEIALLVHPREESDE